MLLRRSSRIPGALAVVISAGWLACSSAPVSTNSASTNGDAGLVPGTSPEASTSTSPSTGSQSSASLSSSSASGTPDAGSLSTIVDGGVAEAAPDAGGALDASVSDAAVGSETLPEAAVEGGHPEPDGSDAAPSDGSVRPATGPVTCGMAYKNPIKTYAHDPTLGKDGNTYYMYYTGDGVPFSTSTDKIHWFDGGTAQGAMPAWTSTLGLAGAPAIWAPDVHFVNGKYYLYYAVSSWGDVTHSAIGLMTSGALDPASNASRWIDQGEVIGGSAGGTGVNDIDPDLFVDDDGTWWLVYGSFRAGVRLVQVDPATGKPLKPTHPVILTTGLGEGSDIIKNDGYYYLFLSTGTCCAGLNSTYEIIYGRSRKVTGPYVSRTGGALGGSNFETLLAAGADGNPGQGGQSFFEENGQMYMVYHAYQRPNGTATLNLRPIYFDPNDWVTLDPCKAKGYVP